MAQTVASKPVKFLPVTDLDDLPGIEWLIQDVLPAQALAVLYGEPGSAKSFAAIDWALHVASGRSWAEKHVTQGTVIYVVAEGARGMKSRMRAWRQTHPEADISRAVVVLEPMMLHEPNARRRFINGISNHFMGAKSPSLIILDTLAQNAVGMDENSAQDMGMWLFGARQLQEKFDATVLIVHHAARGAGRERGSTALRGAADAMIQMRRPSEKVNGYRMSCSKMKEGDKFADVLFELVEVEGTDSAVLRAAPCNTGEITKKPLIGPPALVPNTFNARLHALAASSEPLRSAAEMLVREFPEEWAPGTDAALAAKGRLQRARQKQRAAAAPSGTSLSLMDSIAHLADGAIH